MKACLALFIFLICFIFCLYPNLNRIVLLYTVFILVFFIIIIFILQSVHEKNVRTIISKSYQITLIQKPQQTSINFCFCNLLPSREKFAKKALMLVLCAKVRSGHVTNIFGLREPQNEFLKWPRAFSLFMRPTMIAQQFDKTNIASCGRTVTTRSSRWQFWRKQRLDVRSTGRDLLRNGVHCWKKQLFTL